MSSPERSALLAAFGPAPELIDHLFTFVESIDTLSCLFITCQLLYQRFRARRDRVLSIVLRNELGAVLTDAKFLSIFAYRELSGPSGWTPYWHSIFAGARIYLKMLSPTEQRALAVQRYPALEEPAKMCQDLHYFNYLADAYFKTQLRSFSQDGAPQPVTTKSESERLRVMRALYRRQIISNAWAATERKTIASWFDQDMAVLINPSRGEDYQRPGLLNTLKAWELQQIDHVDFFIKRLCAAVWLVTRTPTQGTEPMSEPDLCGILSRVDRLVPYMRKHPEVIEEAYRILPTVPDQVNLSFATSEDPTGCITLLQRHSLPCFCTGWQRWRLRVYPKNVEETSHAASEESPETSDQQSLARIDFTEDTMDSIPFGWIDSFNKRAVHWYGEALYENSEDEDRDTEFRILPLSELPLRLEKLQLWRESGFAIWDRERIKAIQALDRFRDLRTGWLLF